MAPVAEKEVDVVLNLRDESAAQWRKSIAAQKAHAERLAAEVNRAVSPSFLGLNFKSAKAAIGEESALGQFGKLAMGAGVAAGATMLARAVGTAADNATTLVARFRDGELTARELTGELLRQVPVLGTLVKSADSLGALFTEATGGMSEARMQLALAQAKQAEAMAGAHRATLETIGKSMSELAIDVRYKYSSNLQDKLRMVDEENRRAMQAELDKARAAGAQLGGEMETQIRAVYDAQRLAQRKVLTDANDEAWDQLVAAETEKMRAAQRAQREAAEQHASDLKTLDARIRAARYQSQGQDYEAQRELLRDNYRKARVLAKDAAEQRRIDILHELNEASLFRNEFKMSVDAHVRAERPTMLRPQTVQATVLGARFFDSNVGTATVQLNGLQAQAIMRAVERLPAQIGATLSRAFGGMEFTLGIGGN
jgi:hypothetical protein